MNARWLMIISLLAAAPMGCILQPPTGPSGSATTDIDGDGFFEPDIPDDVVPAGDGELRIALVNELTEDDLAALIGSDIIGIAAGFLDIEVQFDITLSYDSGDEVIDPERRELGAFTISLQFPCPNSLTVTASITVNAPFGLGTLLDETLPAIRLSLSDVASSTTYSCGQVVSVISGTDDAGQIDIGFTVEDFVAP